MIVYKVRESPPVASKKKPLVDSDPCLARDVTSPRNALLACSIGLSNTCEKNISGADSRFETKFKARLLLECFSYCGALLSLLHPYDIPSCELGLPFFCFSIIVFFSSVWPRCMAAMRTPIGAASSMPRRQLFSFCPLCLSLCASGRDM